MLRNRQTMTPKDLITLIGKKRSLFLSPIETNVFYDWKNTDKFSKGLQHLAVKYHAKKAKDIIGSSANAIIALLLGLGYATKDIRSKLSDSDFLKTIDKTKNYNPLSISVNYKAPYRKEFKIFARDNFFIWAQDQIKNKLTNSMATFIDLKLKATKNKNFKNIHLIALNLITGKLEIFNYKNTPDLPLVIALRICMTFSTNFSVVEIKDFNLGVSNNYLDGGIVLQQLNYKGINKKVGTCF